MQLNSPTMGSRAVGHMGPREGAGSEQSKETPITQGRERSLSPPPQDRSGHTYPKPVPATQCQPAPRHWAKLPMCLELQAIALEPQSCCVSAGDGSGAAGSAGRALGLAQGCWQAQEWGTELGMVALPQTPGRLGAAARSAHICGFNQDEGGCAVTIIAESWPKDVFFGIKQDILAPVVPPAPIAVGAVPTVLVLVPVSRAELHVVVYAPLLGIIAGQIVIPITRKPAQPQWVPTSLTLHPEDVILSVMGDVGFIPYDEADLVCALLCQQVQVLSAQPVIALHVPEAILVGGPGLLPCELSVMRVSLDNSPALAFSVHVTPHHAWRRPCWLDDVHPTGAGLAEMAAVYGEPCNSSSGKERLGWERERSYDSVRATGSSCRGARTQDKKGWFYLWSTPQLRVAFPLAHPQGN